MTTTAIVEFLDLWEATADVNLREQQDRTVWRWTPDGKYSAKSAYKMLHTGSIPFGGSLADLEDLGAAEGEDRSKIFLWLLLLKATLDE